MSASVPARQPNKRRRQKTQVVSLQAPTGAGKTIIAAALIESIYYGMTLPDGSTFDEQPEAIFVWLSDSPELNAQSKQKIELKTDKLRFGQCVTIAEESFDMEAAAIPHLLRSMPSQDLAFQLRIYSKGAGLFT